MMRKRRSASPPSDGSRTRRSRGKHSRTGCYTCKIRRVKCDEEKPLCKRCENFKVKCDGYPTQARSNSDRTPTEVAVLLPKTALQPLTIEANAEASILTFENDTEMQYFAFFRDTTSFEMAPYFPSSTRAIILQACDNPSIRHGLIAVAALHRTSMATQSVEISCCDSIYSNSAEDPEHHHSFAIEQYSKALKYMRDATALGHQNLRTTLITCMVIVCFEGYHGNYNLADNQLQIGISLIHDWKETHAPTHRTVSTFFSPEPDVIEDELIQEFGRLELQRISFLDQRALLMEDVLLEEDTAVIQNMLSQFSFIDEARLYLNLVIKRAQHFVHISEAFVADGEPQYSLFGAQFPEESMPPMSLGLLTSFYIISAADILDLERDTLLNEAGSIESQVIHLAELFRWESSFNFILQREYWNDPTPSALILGLHFQVCYIIFLAAVAPKSLELYDNLSDKMANIVMDSEKVLQLLSLTSMTCTVTLDLGIVFPLFFKGYTTSSLFDSQGRNVGQHVLRKEGSMDTEN